jgi:hypothetical protein
MRVLGFGLTETVALLALLALLTMTALPAAARLHTSARCGAGARQLTVALRGVRAKSVASGRTHGLSFQQDQVGWHWYEVRDDNGNGLRAADIKKKVDTILSGPHRLESSVEHVTLGFPPLASIPKIPPATGPLSGLDDPVRLGASDILSFSPLGTGSTGTLYVTDGRNALCAIVLYGKTTRLRVWRFDPWSREWTQ